MDPVTTRVLGDTQRHGKQKERVLSQEEGVPHRGEGNSDSGS